MKKNLLALVSLILIATLLAACGGIVTTSSYSGSGVDHTEEEESWAFTAQSITGYFSRNVEFTADQLRALRVQSAIDAGAVTLTLRQGDAEPVTEQVVDLSGTFDGAIDTSAFTEGSISVRLNFDGAEGLDLFMEW